MSADRAVYFRQEDYASFLRRLFVDFIDAVVLAIVCLLWSFTIALFVPAGKWLFNILFISVLLISWLYLAVLKSSEFGTIGYRVGDVRIVGLDGQRPGIRTLTIRFFVIPWGFAFWFLDMGWIGGDPQGQAIHDKFAHTYVVKRTSEPIGSAPIRFCYYDILGYSFLFQEIER